jgi:hypothetical protein
MNWQLVGTPVENKQAPTKEKYQECYNLGLTMASSINH